MLTTIHSKAHGSHELILDDNDYDLIRSHTWRLHKHGKTFYARTHMGAKSPGVHQLLLLPIEGYVIDHIDGNGLNNSRANLRYCLQSDNVKNRGPFRNNTSGYTGVRWHKKDQQWHARITHNKQQIFLGAFATAELASAAYKSAKKQYHRDFSRNYS